MKVKSGLTRRLVESSQTFFDAYVDAALWSSTDNVDDSGGEPLDKNYGREDIEPDTLAKMKQDCDAFIRDNDADLRVSGLSDEQAGHYFWLNRNGHGTGFWDQGDDPVFKRLDDASDKFGSFDLFVGDNGKIDGS